MPRFSPHVKYRCRAGVTGHLESLKRVELLYLPVDAAVV